MPPVDLKTMTDDDVAQLLRLGMNNDGTTFLSLMMLSILIIGVIHAFFFTEAETIEDALRIFLMPEIDEFVAMLARHERRLTHRKIPEHPGRRTRRAVWTPS